jgi:hypothetical protein
VYRSVNRGGSQCGVHLVPTAGNGLYLGAGNSLSWLEDSRIRFETLRYLMDEVEADVLGDHQMYSAKGSILRGDRCRTIDYKPLLGNLSQNSNIIFATGFNRVGLTFAPLIARDVLNLLTGKEPSYFPGFPPQRSMIPYGVLEESAKEFSNITCANLIEHNLLNYKDLNRKKEDLYLVGCALNKSINTKLSLDEKHGHTPDALSVINEL